MEIPSVLILEQSKSLFKRCEALAVRMGFKVLSASNCAEALQIWRNLHPKFFILGSFADRNQEEIKLAQKIRFQDKSTKLVLGTRFSSEEKAIAALRAGFNEYYRLPIEERQLLESFERECVRLLREANSRRISEANPCSVDAFIGETEKIRKVKQYVQKVSKTNSTVLITGETGTGKECIAQQIHACSLRRKAQLVCINCAALPDNLLESELFGYERGAFTGANASYAGKLQLARGGTVFFDEIGDMSPYAQAKVLRVFENREVTPLRGQTSLFVDVRIIAATNRNLAKMVREKQFRQDLFFRVCVSTIQLPPLRQRKEDIPIIANYYLRRFNERFNTHVQGFTGDALNGLLLYPWPGNVRELKNTLEAIMIEQESVLIGVEDLPTMIRESQVATNRAVSEKDLLLATLISTNWNKSQAAEKLHWSRMTVYRKINKYHIQPTRRATDMGRSNN